MTQGLGKARQTMKKSKQAGHSLIDFNFFPGTSKKKRF